MATITTAARGGTATQIEVDMDSFPAHILASLAIHGLQQKVADACADKNKFETVAQVKERSEAVIAMLISGTWANKAGGAKIRTEEQYVQAMAKRAAEARCKNDAKAAAMPLERVIEAYAKAKGDAWREEYRARMNARSADVELEID